MSTTEPSQPDGKRALPPNDLLRAARHRTASPTSAGRGLSRQQLAELVNTWVFKHHHETLEHSANWIGALERGKIRWPREWSRDALRDILGAPTDAALGFTGDPRSARAAETLEAVDRQQLIQTGLSLGANALILEGPIAAILEIRKPTPTPRRIGATEIAQVRTITATFSSWDFAYGGGPVRDAVMGKLRWAADLRKALCPDELRPELYSAIGGLAHRAGFTAFDVGAHEDARHVLSFALACAEKAEDWDLRAYVLDSMALQAIWTGRPDEGLTLAELGLIRADRLTETVQAMLHTDRGRALAKMRRVNETLTAIGTAEDYFARSTPANDPPILANYNAAFLTGNTGHALFDLAVLGHSVTQATDRLTAAAAGHTAGHARSQALCLTKLASLTMATGDPIQAVTIGHAAVDAAGGIHSGRVTDDLRELARYADAHQHLAEVEHLRHRIATVVCATRA
ncbi:MAG: XRE family transcriptional regulator [Pseudonocardiaceae bacterium]